MPVNREYSYLDGNYSSASSSIVVRNVAFFNANDYLLFVDFGSEIAEIRRAVSIAKSTNSITLNKPTSFAHSESTKILSLPYNKIRWWLGSGPDYDALPSPATPIRGYLTLGDNSTGWNITRTGGTTRWEWSGVGTNPEILSYFGAFNAVTGEMVTIEGGTFNSDNEVEDELITAVGTATREYFEIQPSVGLTQAGVLTGVGLVKLSTQYQDIDPDNFYTIFNDEINTTGFAYFQWWNTATNTGSLSKNPIPYAGFPVNSARAILDDFFSTLNNKELKLISRTDAFTWLNEGYSVLLNELNLINKEYTAELPVSVTTIAGTAEYLLPRNVSRILTVWDNDSAGSVDAITNAEVDYNNSKSSSLRYYTRGVKNVDLNGEIYLGLSPVPAESGKVFTVRYVPKAVPLVKNYDSVYVPNNNFYCLKDYMLFRASPKLNRGSGNEYYQIFQNAVQAMKINAKKQDSGLDSWGADRSTLV